MYLLKGVGLAAPQVGINERLVVINAEGDKGKGQAQHELVLVNPKVSERRRLLLLLLLLLLLMLLFSSVTAVTAAVIMTSRLVTLVHLLFDFPT